MGFSLIKRKDKAATHLSEISIMPMIKMTDLNLAGKRVLIRTYLGQPRHICYDSLATINLAITSGAKVMVLSHQRSTIEGEYDEYHSLKNVVDCLQSEISVPVRFVQNYLDGVEVATGELVVLENCSFNQGERDNSNELARRYSALCDIFVWDNVESYWCGSASDIGIAKFAPVACAGLSMIDLLDAAAKLKNDLKQPLIILDGCLHYDFRLTRKCAALADHILLGSEAARDFSDAADQSIDGRFPWLKRPYAAELYTLCDSPTDVEVSKCRKTLTPATAIKLVNELDEDDQILDIGPETAKRYAAVVTTAKTILWRRSLGYRGREGSRAVAKAVAASSASIICLSPHALELLEESGAADRVAYFTKGNRERVIFYAIIGESLPIVAILEERAKEMAGLIQHDQTGGQTSSTP